MISLVYSLFFQRAEYEEGFYNNNKNHYNFINLVNKRLRFSQNNHLITE